MRKLLLVAFVMSNITFAMAQTPKKVKGNGRVMERDRKVQAFTKVEIDADFEVMFLNNPFEKKVSVSGDMNIMAQVETKVENGTLIVKYRMPLEIVSQTQPIKVVIPTRDITEITSVGSGKLSNGGSFETEKFVLNLKGSSEVNFRFKTDELTINKSGSGNLNLSGNSNTLNINSSGSGDIQARDLTVFFTSLRLAGSGNVYSNTINGIDGEITGSGNLYTKRTKTVNVEEKGSGRIVRE